VVFGHLKAVGSTEELVRTLPGAEQSQDDSVTAQEPKERRESWSSRDFRSVYESKRPL
jgi:hypothetical protein